MRFGIIVAGSILGTCLTLCLPTARAAEETSGSAPAAGLLLRNVTEFGDIKTPAALQATFAKALEELTAAKGGILVIPESAPNAELANTARWSHSTKPASCDLRDWAVGPGVLVIDNRNGSTTLRVPQVGDGHNAGITLERTMNLPKGDSLKHWTEESVLNIENNVVRGPCNYMEVIQEPVEAGADRRFYVPTIRNLFKGMYLNAHQGPWYEGKVARITVKDIGYDPERKMGFFTADTTINHVKNAMMQNKSHVNALRITSNMNAANQTWDAYITRNHYANGDSELMHLRFDYMGNVHSMPGDENGGCLVAHTHSLTNIFQGAVDKVDQASGTLVFKNGTNTATLANTRPLINLNPARWINKGTVIVVPPNDPARPYETDDYGIWVYKGKSYPSRSDAKGLHVGGLIRGSVDCPWDESVIGRFFAIDEKSEYVTDDKDIVRRWYRILELQRNPDGTKDLRIERYWWGAKAWDSVTLYDPENYTRDGHERPLAYVIAPGAYVNDVAEALQPSSPATRNTLGISPYPDQGGAFDFAPGDRIEQAIGADPFKPQGFRFWAFDKVPGAWPSSAIDLANNSEVSRAAAISVRGGADTIEKCMLRRERRPAWDSVLRVESAATVGVDCAADFADAAILFRQPNHEQPIKWHYDRAKGRAPREASLTVDTGTGDFTFSGGALRTDSSIVTKGLSGGDTPARNLRGTLVPVKEGSTSATIAFPVEETDGAYAVFLETTWLTNRAVGSRTGKGFTVTFEKPAPAAATLDWMLVR